MKKLYILLLIIGCSSVSLKAQQHNFSYDQNGNRIRRQYVVIPPPNNPFRKKAPTDSTEVSTLEIKAYPNPVLKASSPNEPHLFN
jgi:hypothetical protein